VEPARELISIDHCFVDDTLYIYSGLCMVPENLACAFDYSGRFERRQDVYSRLLLGRLLRSLYRDG